MILKKVIKIKYFHHYLYFLYLDLILDEHNNQNNSSFIIDNTNPFLHAPFHHSPANKQISSTNTDRTITTTNLSVFDPNSIIVGGKRISAFAPYHKQEINSDNHGSFRYENLNDFIIKIFV
jgi:hypothetical protein